MSKGRHWTGCPGKWNAPALEAFMARLRGAAAAQPSGSWPCLWQRAWNWMVFKILPKSNHSTSPFTQQLLTTVSKNSGHLLILSEVTERFCKNLLQKDSVLTVVWIMLSRKSTQRGWSAELLSYGNTSMLKSFLSQPSSSIVVPSCI